MKKQRSVSICTGGGGRALPAKLGIEDTTSPCHAELDSASVPCRELPVTLDRSRNKFGMTLKEMTLVCAFTMADRLSRIHNGLVGLRSAFTMAEILLSLTIIGVVAAITLPSLTGNINERTWNTQRKALYARMSQAIALMPSLNGYGKLSGTISDDGSQSVTEDTAAETFVTDGLSKVLKINNICDNEHLKDCGLASKITNIKGDSLDFPFDMQTLNSGILSQNFAGHPSYNQLNTKAAAFETQNGESIAVYYNPNCSINQAFTNYWNYVQPLFCANFLYDLNGSKGPNTVGKDLGFITVFYAVDPVVVAPVPLMQNSATGVSQIAAGKECLKFSDDSRVPNKEELAAMYINKELIGNWDAGGFYLSSSTDIYEGAPAAWTVDINHGTMYKTSSRTQGHALRCIKR